MFAKFKEIMIFGKEYKFKNYANFLRFFFILKRLQKILENTHQRTWMIQ